MDPQFKRSNRDLIAAMASSKPSNPSIAIGGLTSYTPNFEVDDRWGSSVHTRTDDAGSVVSARGDPKIGRDSGRLSANSNVDRVR